MNKKGGVVRRKKLKIHSRWDKEKKSSDIIGLPKSFLLWTLPIIAFLLVLFFVFYFAFLKDFINKDLSAGHPVQSSVLPVEKNDSEVEVKATYMEVADKFLRANKPEDFKGLIRHEERVLKVLEMTKESSFTALQNWKLKELKSDEDFVHLNVLREALPSRTLILEATKEGWRVDWESFVVYQEVDWELLRSGQLEGEFTLRAKVTSGRGRVLLKDPVNKRKLIANIPEDFLLKSQLSALQNIALTLKVKAKKGDLEVIEVIRDGWVL